MDSHLLLTRDHQFKHCIVFVANDRVYEQTVAFLESLKLNSPGIPLVCIPYAEDTQRLEKIANIYGFHFFIDYDLCAIQNIAEIIYGRPINRLRKLAAYQVPCDEFLSLDIDIIVRKDLRPMFGHIGEVCDIVYTDVAWGGTYHDRSHPLISHSKEINTGAYISSPHVMNYPDLVNTIMSYFKEFKEICFLPNDDQAFMSFYFDLAHKRYVSVDELGLPFSARLWYLHPFEHRDNDVWDPANGKPVPMVHFAGTGHLPPGEYGPFSMMYNHYLQFGLERIRKELDEAPQFQE